MKKSILALFAGLGWALLMNSACGAQSKLGTMNNTKSSLAELVVTAVASKTDKGDEAIRFELENKGAAEIELFRDMLPWVTRSTMIMTLIPLRQGGVPLDKIHLIDDPGPTPIKLSAGERLTGTLPLSECFNDYKGSTAKSDFVVFWSWQGLDAGGASRRYSGIVEFVAGAR